MTEYMQILTANQGIATLVLITVATNLGLLIAALIAGAMNQVRVTRTLRQIKTLEDRILARLLILTDPAPVELTLEGTPVTLEDLIKMDLMEQMGQDPDLMTPATEEELTKILTETLGKGTNPPTTVKVGTTERVENPET